MVIRIASSSLVHYALAHKPVHAESASPVLVATVITYMLSCCLCVQLAAEAERASPPHPSGGAAHEGAGRLRRAATPEDDEALGGPPTSECSDLPPFIAALPLLAHLLMYSPRQTFNTGGAS